MGQINEVMRDLGGVVREQSRAVVDLAGVVNSALRIASVEAEGRARVVRSVRRRRDRRRARSTPGAGRPQPGAQRRAGHPHRRPDAPPHRGARARPRRSRADRGRRHGAGRAGERGRARLRAVLHHAGDVRGHGARPVAVAGHRAGGGRHAVVAQRVQTGAPSSRWTCRCGVPRVRRKPSIRRRPPSERVNERGWGSLNPRGGWVEVLFLASCDALVTRRVCTRLALQLTDALRSRLRVLARRRLQQRLRDPRGCVHPLRPLVQSGADGERSRRPAARARRTPPTAHACSGSTTPASRRAATAAAWGRCSGFSASAICVGRGRQPHARVSARRDVGPHDAQRRRPAARRRQQPSRGVVRSQLPQLRSDLRLRSRGHHPRRPARACSPIKKTSTTTSRC